MQLKEGCVETCPGCAHRNLSFEASLSQKEQWLKKMLSPWANCFSAIRSLPENARWDYRGKVCLNTRYHNGEWEFGMLRRDDFINIPNCPVHSKKVRQTISLLKNILPPGNQFPMAFYYHAHSQVTLVLKTKIVPDTLWLSDSLKQQLCDIGIEGLAIHLHPSAGRRLFDKWGWHQVYGRNFSFDAHGLIYGNTAFHQLVPTLYNESLDMAQKFFGLEKSFSVVDLYCGRGASLVRWHNTGQTTIGIETSGEAIVCARINSPESTVFQGTCERRLPQLEQWRLLQREQLPNIKFMLYTNPPRTGMEPVVTDWVVNNLRPSKIAYLSCSAGTLKRDLDKLVSYNYKVKSIVPFDFFPFTYHVECLTLLEKE